MAKTIRQGVLVSGPGLGGGLSNPIHSHAGRILAVLISHAQPNRQTVTFYNADHIPIGGGEILTIQIGPSNSPRYIRFDRDQAIPFSTALSVYASNCDLAIWSIDYG